MLIVFCEKAKISSRTGSDIIPEIPEIETVRFHIESKILKKTIEDVIINREKALNVSSEQFINEVKGCQVVSVRRRAKQIIMSLSNESSLIIHFMLEGFTRLFYNNEEVNGTPSVLLLLNSGEKLAFFKITLGYIHLVPTTDLENMNELADIGPEPLEDDFTKDKFIALLSERKGMIKPLLMDQKFLAGIGNVYSNETLFCSGIMPTRKVKQIEIHEQVKLYSCIREILRKAINLGGVYDEKFASDDELTGGYESQLQVAYRTGKPCFICQHIIETKKVGGRNAFYCPVCQK